MAMTREEVTGVLGALNLITSAAAEFKRIDVAETMSILDRELKESMQTKAIEMEASKSMYNENMKIYEDARISLDLLETEYNKAVGDISSLGELYKSSGNQVVRDVYEGEATDYTARAEWALNNANEIKSQMKTLQGSIYGDIKRAQNIIAGGAGFRGGASKEIWDAGDIGLIAYEIQYGKASPTVESLFKNNIGAINQSLTTLRKTEQTFALTGQKMKYYEERGIAAEEKSENIKAELIFGTLSNTSKKTSGMQDLQALQYAASNFDLTDTSDAAKAEISKNEQGQFALLKSIGAEFSKLIGKDAKPEDYIDIAEEYIEMQNLGVGDAASLLGQTAHGNWAAFKGYVDDAAKEFVSAVQSGDSEKAKILQALAQKYFGMPPGVSLTQFAFDIGEQYSKTILASLKGNGLINDTNLNNLNIINDDEEWDELLNE
jgi:hypothetical protein